MRFANLNQPECRVVRFELLLEAPSRGVAAVVRHSRNPLTLLRDRDDLRHLGFPASVRMVAHVSKPIEFEDVHTFQLDDRGNLDRPSVEGNAHIWDRHDIRPVPFRSRGIDEPIA